MSGNLLGREVTAEDVAQAFLPRRWRSKPPPTSPPSTAAISPRRCDSHAMRAIVIPRTVKGAMTMLRHHSLIGLLPLLLLATPASALTKAQKMETCKFGADDQKLEGAKRKAFIAKCMSNGMTSAARPCRQEAGGEEAHGHRRCGAYGPEAVAHADFRSSVTRAPMPEADKEGERYQADKPQAAPGFFLKGSHQLDWGMKNRLARTFNPAVRPHRDAGRSTTAISRARPPGLSASTCRSCRCCRNATRCSARAASCARSSRRTRRSRWCCAPAAARASCARNCPTSRSPWTWTTRCGSTPPASASRCSSAASTRRARCTT